MLSTGKNTACWPNRSHRACDGRRGGKPPRRNRLAFWTWHRLVASFVELLDNSPNLLAMSIPKLAPPFPKAYPAPAGFSSTGATSLIINHLRCNIWRNICATGAQHFAAFLGSWSHKMVFQAFCASKGLLFVGPNGLQDRRHAIAGLGHLLLGRFAGPGDIFGRQIFDMPLRASFGDLLIQDGDIVDFGR